MLRAAASAFRGKPCLQIGNEAVQLHVALGGGAILSANAPGVRVQPLWVPPWDTVPSGFRRLHARSGDFSAEEEHRLESELLACIGGHSLCCDVFGEHSAGEVLGSGLSFHGEAGLRERALRPPVERRVC